MGTTNARLKILTPGTALASATVVLASIAGALIGPSPKGAPLIVCAAAYLAVMTWGSFLAERRQGGHAALIGVVSVIGLAAVWLSDARSTLILMPLLCVTAVYFSVRWALVLTGISTAWIFVVTLASRAGAGAAVNGAASFVSAAVFVVIFSRLVVKERLSSKRIERLAADIEAKNQQLQAYSAQIEELATLQERSRIAREIHDGLGHYLTSAHMQMETARLAIGSAGPETGAAQHVARAQHLLHEGLGEVRRSVAMLRSPDANRPFARALSTLLNEVRAAGITADLDIQGDVRPLGPAIEFVLYRAAQEALTNVRRHARAKKVTLRVRYGDDDVGLSVEDDGVGATDPRQGFGLIGVRERVELVGGTIELATAPGGGGFSLRVRIAS